MTDLFGVYVAGFWSARKHNVFGVLRRFLDFLFIHSFTIQDSLFYVRSGELASLLVLWSHTLLLLLFIFYFFLKRRDVGGWHGLERDGGELFIYPRFVV